MDSWLRPETPDAVFDAIGDLGSQPLTLPRLNQLLTLRHEAPMLEAFYSYYWLQVPEHTYNVRKLPEFNNQYQDAQNIESIDQLYWGMYRFYVDALLYFGNVRTAYQHLRQLSAQELRSFFAGRRIADLTQRGATLPLKEIARDNRYLVSEMACKSFDVVGDATDSTQIETILLDIYEEYRKGSSAPITVKALLDREYASEKYEALQPQMQLSVDDFGEDMIEGDDDLKEKIRRIARQFAGARQAALYNTEQYLSMVGDLDVYVATSMRTRQDFRDMADFCLYVFGHQLMHGMDLRYFDPTLSGAQHHEDKGVIECLMVKCAKILIYNAGRSDSYGKDAEAAMALSLGKPVIIFADDEFRSRFFRDIHPLSRLINIENGVVVGAMVATSEDEVVQLLDRILSNSVEYELDQVRPQYLVLKECITGSVVRLQTSDALLRETFWNHYHNRRA